MLDIASIDLNKLTLKRVLYMAKQRRNETEVIELKENIIKPAEISDYIAQFSNNRGGLLILGLRDNGVPSGKIKNFTKENENLIITGDLITTPIVGIGVKPFQMSDKSCWVIAIKIPKPMDGIQRMASDGALVKRVGSRRSKIQPIGYSDEKQIISNATLNDLDSSELDRFYKKLKEKAPYITIDRDSILEQFQVLRCDENNILRPTIAGIVLFGKSPEVWVSGTRINIIRYSTLEKSSNVIDSVVLSGPMIKNIDEIDKFVWNVIRKSGLVISGTRLEIPEYPYLAIREATHNALFHNDYHVPGDIFIEIFPNRLEVRNMGVPLGGTRLADLISKPKQRNRIMLKILSEMGYVEGWGVGLRTMVDQLKSVGLPDPVLTVSNEETCMCFNTHAFLDADTLNWIQNITSATPQPINIRQLVALGKAKNGEKITNQQYQEWNDVTVHVAGNELRQLCSLGLFVLLGKGRNAYYALAEKFDSSETELEKYVPRVVLEMLRPPQRKILLIISRFHKINAKQICYQLGYSDERGVKRELKNLVMQNLIKRVGKSMSDPFAYYELNVGYKKSIRESKPGHGELGPEQLTMF